MVRLGLIILLALGLTACASPRQDLADRMSKSGFEGRWHSHQGVTMLIAVREGKGGTPILVIEGDGTAYGPGGNPQADPTPVEPTAPKIATALARAYPDSQVIYAARPCQFFNEAELRNCPSTLWTQGRFSAQVRAAYLALIGNAKPVIVGYSGGGVIAAHLAAEGKASALLTVAAPLALNQWAASHGISGFALEDDPLLKRGNIQVPERHIAGSHDRRVSPSVVDRFSPNDVWMVQRGEHGSDYSQAVVLAMKDLKVIRRGR